MLVCGTALFLIALVHGLLYMLLCYFVFKFVYCHASSCASLYNIILVDGLVWLLSMLAIMLSYLRLHLKTFVLSRYFNG